MDVKLCSLALLVLLVGLAAAYEEEEWTHHAVRFFKIVLHKARWAPSGFRGNES